MMRGDVGKEWGYPPKLKEDEEAAAAAAGGAVEPNPKPDDDAGDGVVDAPKPKGLGGVRKELGDLVEGG